jgi:hypothetical protein
MMTQLLQLGAEGVSGVGIGFNEKDVHTSSAGDPLEKRLRQC